MRLYSNVGTVSQTVRSGNGPYIAKDHARPALLTVFSTTQLDHSTSQCESMPSQLKDSFLGLINVVYSPQSY